MEEVSIAAAIVSVALALVAIWLSVMFFRMSTEASTKIGEASKDIAASVTRLEKLFDNLYSDTFNMMKDTVGDMRRHIWPEDATSSTDFAEVERRTDEKVQEIRNELAVEMEELGRRAGLTDARLGALRDELVPMISDAIEKTRRAAPQAREETLRSRLLRTLALRGRSGAVRANDLVARPPSGADSVEVIAELERMYADGLIDWEDHALGPETEIRRVPRQDRDAVRARRTAERMDRLAASDRDD